MPQDWSPDEAHDRDIAVMGEELGSRYHELHLDLVWLHARWHLFRQLFAESVERVELLNQTAPLFFSILRDTFIDDVLMQLARLTDPATTCGRANLSLQALSQWVADADLREALEEAVAAAVARCGFARDYRNKLIAHRDLSVALDLVDEALPGLRDSEIQAALDACAVALNLITLRFYDSMHLYRAGVAADGGAENLVYYLEKGLSAASRKSAGGGLTSASS